MLTNKRVSLLVRIFWREAVLAASIFSSFAALIHAWLGGSPVEWILAGLVFLCTYCIVRKKKIPAQARAPDVAPVASKAAVRSLRRAEPEPAFRPRDPNEGRVAPAPPTLPHFLAYGPEPAHVQATASRMPVRSPDLRETALPSSRNPPLAEADGDEASEPGIVRRRHDKRRPPGKTWTGI